MTTIDTPLNLPTEAELDAAARLADRPAGRHDGKPPVPDLVDHEVAPTVQQVDPARKALVEELEKLVPSLSGDRGGLLWLRTDEWVPLQRVPSSVKPENDDDTPASEYLPDDMLDDRKVDRLASRYHDEVRTTAARMLADARRLNKIAGLVLPPQPRAISTEVMLQAQIAAEGWCVSCWRYNQTIVERPKTKRGYRHKEACESCVDFKAKHGIYPPLSLLEIKHGQLKNWTETIVQAALAEAKKPTMRASGRTSV